MPNSLLKKAFILFARINKVDSAVVLSKSTYAEVTNVVGCFKRGEQYVVYEKDERGQIKEQIVNNEMEAYCILANKFNLDFYEWVNSYSEEFGIKGLHK